MKITAKNISVDSGTIFIADKSYFQTKGKKEERLDLYQEFKVPNGEYECFWFMPNTWNGQVKGQGLLKVTTGKIVVSDPCYLISDSEWRKFLDDTDFGSCPEYGTVSLNEHGGDGTFEVQITLKKI